ncbi:hypothetical protein [uncultured Rheinheimera sp.]|uniref:hypothetical protein n=1 Tax=uncultured Rheinheimera sp. TaxID=400532 RepID=UPI002597204C|nr:hypothetical protein [uncultured Rheinheimera sp.]
MAYSIPIFFAAIGIVAGFMIASVFVYLALRFNDTLHLNQLNFMQLGLVTVLLFSLFFSFSMNWLVGGIELKEGHFTFLNLGIFLAKLILAASSTLLGYILTFHSIKSSERSQR